MLGCVFDIETTSLSAVTGGMVLCATVKELNGKMKTFRYDKLKCEPGQEKLLLVKIFNELSKYHLWIGHNIENFDWPFLTSRALMLGVDAPRGGFSYDTCKAWRRTGFRTMIHPATGKPVASLDHVVDFFGLPQQKTSILPREHWLTVWGTGRHKREAMNNLVSHCEADVDMTEQVYWKLLDYDRKARINRLP